MNIQIIHEHKVAIDLLPDYAVILDLGCRGFGFTAYFRGLEHFVVAVDMDELPEFMEYKRLAITDYTGYIGIDKPMDKQATHVCHGDDVECMTLADFTKSVDVRFWDLIKMDVEGSEYEIIMDLKEPPGTQLSIEFHLHTNIYGTDEMTKMIQKLESLGYISVDHELTNQHGAGMNYWDSLFILE